MTGNYAEFRHQAKAVRNRMIADATSRAEKWLRDTLAVLDGMSQEDGPAAQTDSGAAPLLQSVSPPDGKNMSAVIRWAVDQISKKKFSTIDVRKLVVPHCELATASQQANLSNTLRRMVKSGQLQIVSKGRGSRSSTFRKVGASD